MEKLTYAICIPIIFILLWSSGYIFVESGLRYSTPLLFLSLRFIIASIILAIILLIRKTKIELTIKEIIQISLTGILLQGVYLGFFFFALNEKISPGILAIILGVQPLLIAILIREKLLLRQKLGLFLGFIGLSLTIGNIIFNGNINFLGITSAFIALAGITIGTVLQKKYCVNVPLDLKMFIHYLISALLIIIVCLLFEKAHVVWTYKFLISLLWVSVVMSIGAFYLFFALLKLGKASSVTSLLYCVPPVTAGMDYLIFHNSLPFYSIVGMMFVIISLILIHQRT